MAGKKYNVSFKELRQILNLLKDHALLIDLEYRQDRTNAIDPTEFEGLEEDQRARVVGLDFSDHIRPVYTCTIYTTTAVVEYEYNYKYNAIRSLRVTSDDPTDPDVILNDLFIGLAGNGYPLPTESDDDIIIDTGRVVQFIDSNIEDADAYKAFISLDSEEEMKSALKNYKRVTFKDEDIARVVLNNSLGRIEKSAKYNVIRYRYASTDELRPEDINDENFYECFEMITK